MRIAIASVLLFLSAGSGLAQTRASGPWWPNPTWGAGDQAGASNWITPEKIVEAVRLVKTGKVYEIGQVYQKGNSRRRAGRPQASGPCRSGPASGDALLFRYGWSRFWKEPAKYDAEPPGIVLEVARWVAERKASMVGSDQSGTEVQPSPDATQAYPVHQELMMKKGIYNLENLTLEELSRDGVSEFLFVFTPVRFKGATGSPGRPIAIR